ncbi:hypothetical protein B0H21DRAFT_820149 [Amylocystis lapponica]|nr:hypothetical protein B0H21DRAFT_820149 [Amylocystis lapponica]
MPTAKELSDVEVLIAMMGGAMSPDVVLRVLRAHHGNLEKAASALLENNVGDIEMPELVLPDAHTSGSPGPGPRTPPPSKPQKGSVIDLTVDDEDLSRALQASLEDAPRFGPSTRAPDPNWAVVPSNVEAGAVGMSQDDQSLSRAIEASLSYDPSNETFEEVPLQERIRKGGRPVALRPTRPTLTHAGLILHGLFFVPQVRHSIAHWRPHLEVPVESTDLREVSPPASGPAHMVWSLLEIFANMDLALLSELSVDAAIEAFETEHWNSPVERPGDVSFQFYNKLALAIESSLCEGSPDASPESLPRLFHFRYGPATADLSHTPFDHRLDLSVVKVDVRGTPDTNDLISCVTAELALGTSQPHVIFAPSAVVAFQLVRADATVGKAERQTFRYPRAMFLDQFLQENAEAAEKRRARQRELNAKIEQLAARRGALVRNKDRDTLADVRASLHYYEHVAEHGDDPARQALLHDTALKLRKVLTRIENELQTIDATVAKLRAEAAAIFDCPELQKHRYDLRAVLVHDGLYGRNHLYSYVKQKGVWWKTLDFSVTEVPEDTVLNDPVGLHLGAGPYFLIYSRALPEEDEDMRAPWPEDIKNSVKHNNRMFLRQLSPEIAAQVHDPNSPPSSPSMPLTPSDYTISSVAVEPPESRGEPMDMTE